MTKSKKQLKQEGKKSSSKKNIPKISGIVIIILIISFFMLRTFSDLFKPSKEENRFSFVKNGELMFFDSTNTMLAKIDIEISDNEYKQQLGLMYRDTMDEYQGMLFIFPLETYRSFWMRNTILSLDIIFINSQKEIVNIHKNTTPYSESSYPSTAPAIYVVEVNAGFTDKHGIKQGDRIEWTSTRLKL